MVAEQKQHCTEAEYLTLDRSASDRRVNFPETHLYAYPDSVIVCGEPALLPGRRTADEFDNLINPTAIIEVLSGGIEAYDRGRTFYHYRAVSTITDYTFVDSQLIGVEVQRKNEQGLWTVAEDISELTGQFSIGTIELTIALSKVYDRTTGPLSDAPAPTATA